MKSLILALTVLVALVLIWLLALLPADAGADEVLSSWYGEELLGSPTATGEPFDPYGYTAASRTLPMGTHLKVCYVSGCALVRVNDYGPAEWTGRDLDLSRGAADAVGLTQYGEGFVYVEVLP